MFHISCLLISQIGANFTFCGAISQGLLGLTTTFSLQTYILLEIESKHVSVNACFVKLLVPLHLLLYGKSSCDVFGKENSRLFVGGNYCPATDLGISDLDCF